MPTPSSSSTRPAGTAPRPCACPTTSRLLPLPPYSPELNPVENLWQFLKHNFLNARVFDTYDAIVAACCDAWNRLRAIPGQIRSITTRDWAKTVMN